MIALLAVDIESTVKPERTRNGIIRLVDVRTATVFSINRGEVGKWAIIIPKAPIVTFNTYDEALSFLVYSK